jgi:dihydroorotase
MKILLRKIHVISPGSPHHLKAKDILIEDEKILSVGNPESITAEGAEVIQGDKLYVSPGWFDLHVNFAEPGFEYKEDIESGCRAAMQGGFTGVLVMPDTDPPVSARPSVEYILRRAARSLVDVYVAGTLSSGLQGKDLSDMYDMFLAGTRVFTDDKHAVQDAGLMTRALLYSKNFGGRIFSFAEEKKVAGNGFVNEGVHATRLGLRGIPGTAEEIMISRDIHLAEYTESPLHFSTVSTGKGVELIRQAKARGVRITADVSATHLLLDDAMLSGFDSRYKLKPPLRTRQDREKLIEGLCDGTIDCITSDHVPQDVENKVKEFELAAFGAGGLETAFAAARLATKEKLSLPELIAKFTLQPRKCAGLKSEWIDQGQHANLTLFDADRRWTVQEENIFSKSKNNPFIGMSLAGKAVAVINKGQILKCA